MSKNIVYAALGVVAGLILAGYGFMERSEVRRFHKVGRPAVVDPITDYTKNNSLLLAEFHFTTEDGKQIVKKRSFPEEALDDFKAGTPVRVLYLPHDPSTFIFEKDTGSWTLVLCGAFLILCSLFLGVRPASQTG